MQRALHNFSLKATISTIPVSCSLIGHFRVSPGLCIKTRLGAQHFLRKWVLFAWEWKLFPYQRLSTLPRFDTEILGNSEMAIWVIFPSFILLKILKEILSGMFLTLDVILATLGARDFSCAVSGFGRPALGESSSSHARKNFWYPG